MHIYLVIFSETQQTGRNPAPKNQTALAPLNMVAFNIVNKYDTKYQLHNIKTNLGSNHITQLFLYL